jgi:hypothetical protein
MNRRFCIYSILLVLMIPGKVEGQRWRLQRYEAGIGLGTTHPFMDIGSEADALKSLQLSDTRIMDAPHIGYKLLEDFTVKLDLNYLMIGGADADTRARSFSYTSHCFEPVLRVDYNIVGGAKELGVSAKFNKRGMINNYGASQVYVFVGGGGILSKAKVRDVDGEEVLDNPYYHNNLTGGFVLPAGIGYKLVIDAYFDFSFEIGGRFTTTDRIDGYWNVEASQFNDRYIPTNFKAIYKISNDRWGVPTFKKHDKW